VRPDPQIAVLMAVYQGAAHLGAQLDSLAAQSHAGWQLIASDDASRDGSGQLLAEFAQQWPHSIIRQGPGQGGTANFMSLIAALDPEGVARGTWMAFSDQDDVWLPDRLARGVAALDAQAGPAMFCSRTWITDEQLESRRISAPRPRALGFRNALVQNVASGNTILLNAAAADLVRDAAPEALAQGGMPVVHDWWIYQLIAGVGGVLVHEDAPTLLYRQHGVNQIGANDGTRARIKRIRMLLAGDMRNWNAVNIGVLGRSATRLTPENRALLVDFAAMRGAALPARLWRFRRLGLSRQTRISTVALWVAACLGRL
jgi:hypothetical protein